MEPITISLSKKKLVKSLIGSVVFVIIGTWMLFTQPETSNPVFNNTLIKNGAAIICVVFFGAMIFLFIGKLRDKKYGLTIDDKGFHDNSSATAVGSVLWEDIEGFMQIEVVRQKMIVVYVNNPDYYIERETKGWVKKTRKYNFNQYGSPIIISAHALNCSVQDLKKMLEKGLEVYKSLS
jgi:hypothetical protein